MGAPRLSLLAVTPLLLLLSSGCTPGARLKLSQPFAPAAQRDMALTGADAFVARDAEQTRVLLELPVPGDPHGPRDFRVYLELPAGDGVFAVGGAAEPGARGFLLQLAGRLAGRTEFSGGTARVRHISWPQPRADVHLDLQLGDGAALRGTALATPDADRFARFDARYGGDIAVLRGEPTTQPATPGGATRPDGAPASAPADAFVMPAMEFPPPKAAGEAE